MKLNIHSLAPAVLLLVFLLSLNSCAENDPIQEMQAVEEMPVDAPYSVNDDGSVSLRTDCNGDDVIWEYEGDDGPDFWPDLCSHWACGGIAQSPVNIVPPLTSSPSKYLSVDWNPTGTHIVNNGHTIQFNYAAGSKISMVGGDYKLLQFHFHASSEHTVKGEHLPVEIHFVHQNMTTGKLLVVSSFVDTDGEKDATAFFDRYINFMPIGIGEYTDVNDIFNASMLVPDSFEDQKKQRFWWYSGSLTTPPCSETVSWVVLKDKVRATQFQLDLLAERLNHNNRPVQPLFSRIVTSHGPILPLNW